MSSSLSTLPNAGMPDAGRPSRMDVARLASSPPKDHVSSSMLGA
jgi:hypothetical protein